MRKFILNMILAVTLTSSLTACWLAAGAAGGYIYSEERNKQDGDRD